MASPIAASTSCCCGAQPCEQGFTAPLWITYKQAQELGGQVRKGEKGSLVVYANTITRTEQDAETGEDTERQIPFMKGYTVFNAEQVEGLPAAFLRRRDPCPGPPAPDRSCRGFLCKYRRNRPAWRQSGLLHDRRGPRADAAL